MASIFEKAVLAWFLGERKQNVSEKISNSIILTYKLCRRYGCKREMNWHFLRHETLEFFLTVVRDGQPNYFFTAGKSFFFHGAIKKFVFW